MRGRLQNGAPIELLRLEGAALTLVSPEAFAPGSPIRFRVAGDAGERALEGRTIGSRRDVEGRFEVRVRLVNLRREDREMLAAGLG